MFLDAFTELAGGLDHPEGVTLGPDGLVYAGGEAGQIFRIGADGWVTELASTGGLPVRRDARCGPERVRV